MTLRFFCFLNYAHLVVFIQVLSKFPPLPTTFFDTLYFIKIIFSINNDKNQTINFLQKMDFQIHVHKNVLWCQSTGTTLLRLGMWLWDHKSDNFGLWPQGQSLTHGTHLEWHRDMCVHAHVKKAPPVFMNYDCLLLAAAHVKKVPPVS